MESTLQSKQESTLLKSNKKAQSPGVKLYLAAYNAFQFFGWAYALLLAVQFLITNGLRSNYGSLWSVCSTTVCLFQSIQLMEVLHALLRFVPSSPFQTLTQITSRLVLVWGVLVPVLESRQSIGVPMLLVAWSIAETTRYFYYGFHLYESAPYISLWLRYSLFLVLYPVGVSGELFTTYASLSAISKSKLWTIELPNWANISFYYSYILIAFMLSYFYFFPQLFFLMLNQRKKFLGSNFASGHGQKSKKN